MVVMLFPIWAQYGSVEGFVARILFTAVVIGVDPVSLTLLATANALERSRVESNKTFVAVNIAEIIFFEVANRRCGELKFGSLEYDFDNKAKV